MSTNLLSGSLRNFRNVIKTPRVAFYSDPQYQPKSVTGLPALGVGCRNMASSKVISLETVNPNIVRMEYAVRGPLVTRAGEIEKELEQVGKDYHNNYLFLLKNPIIIPIYTFYFIAIPIISFYETNLNEKKLRKL